MAVLVCNSLEPIKKDLGRCLKQSELGPEGGRCCYFNEALIWGSGLVRCKCFVTLGNEIFLINLRGISYTLITSGSLTLFTAAWPVCLFQNLLFLPEDHAVRTLWRGSLCLNLCFLHTVKPPTLKLSSLPQNTSPSPLLLLLGPGQYPKHIFPHLLLSLCFDTWFGLYNSSFDWKLSILLVSSAWLFWELSFPYPWVQLSESQWTELWKLQRNSSDGARGRFLG